MKKIENCTWKKKLAGSFFRKFMGDSADNIIHVNEKSDKSEGDAVHFFLQVPMTGGGVLGDDTLKGKETYIPNRYVNLSESNKSLEVIDNMILENFYESPTPDRIVYGGSAESETSIKNTDVFNTSTILRALTLATQNVKTRIKPIRIGNEPIYIMLVDEYQAKSLKTDQSWQGSQTELLYLDTTNPIFSDAMGICSKVLVFQYDNILRTPTGYKGTMVGHALFLGEQALLFAIGEKSSNDESIFNRTFGMLKPRHKLDGENETDFGVINVMTASNDD